MYSRILVPVDGSEASSGALNEAVQLAKEQGGVLRLLHIVKANAETTVREQGLAPECLLIESVAGSSAAVILDQARQWPADLM
jgi:nucleotide-binding universal stress UspA family protein